MATREGPFNKRKEGDHRNRTPDMAPQAFRCRKLTEDLFNESRSTFLIEVRTALEYRIKKDTGQAVTLEKHMFTEYKELSKFNAKILRLIWKSEDFYSKKVLDIGEVLKLSSELIKSQSESLKIGDFDTFVLADHIQRNLHDERIRHTLMASHHMSRLDHLRLMSFANTRLDLLMKEAKEKKIKIKPMSPKEVRIAIRDTCSREICRDTDGRKWFIFFMEGNIVMYKADHKGNLELVCIDECDFLVYLTRPRYLLMTLLACVEPQHLAYEGVNVMDLTYDAMMELLAHIERHGNRGFTAVNSIRPLCAKTLTEVRSELFLQTAGDNIVEALEHPTGKALVKGAPFDYSNSLLRKLIESMPCNFMMTPTVLENLMPDPCLSCVDMVIEKCIKNGEVVEITQSMANDIGGMVVAMIIVGHKRKYGSYPNIHNPGTEDMVAYRAYNKLLLLFEKGVDSVLDPLGNDDEKMTLYELSLLEFDRTALLEVDRNPFNLLKDSLSYDNPAAFQEWVEHGTIAYENKRLVLKYLMQEVKPVSKTIVPVMDHILQVDRPFDALGNLNPYHKPGPSSLGGSHPKATENKSIPREFCSNPAECRALILACEAAIKNIMEYDDSPMMGGPATSQKERIEEGRMLLRDPLRLGIELNFDFENWNAKADREVTCMVLRKALSYHGVEHYDKLCQMPYIFSAVPYLAQEYGAEVVRQGCPGGAEGMLQKTWTLETILRTKLQLASTGLPYVIHECGDDLNLYICTTIARDDPERVIKWTEMMSSVLIQMHQSAAASNHTLKASQMMVSSDGGMFLGEAHSKGFPVPRGARMLCRGIGLSNCITQCTPYGAVIDVMGSSIGNADHTTDGRLSLLLHSLVAVLVCLEDGWLTEVENPYKDLPARFLTALAFVPISIGGFNCGGSLRHLLNGRSDPLIDFAQLIARVQHNPNVDRTVKEFLVSCFMRKPAKTDSPVTMFKNPWSVCCYKVATPQDVLLRALRLGVGPLVKNPVIRKLMQEGSEENMVTFCQALLNTENMTPMIGAFCLQFGSWTEVDKLVNVLSSGTGLEIIGMQESGGQAIHKIREDIKQSGTLHRELINKLRDNAPDIVYPKGSQERHSLMNSILKCPAAAVLQLRQMNERAIAAVTGRKEINVWDTAEDCLETHIHYCHNFAFPPDGHTMLGTSFFRRDWVSYRSPADEQNATRRTMIEMRTGKPMPTIQTSGLLDKEADLTHLPPADQMIAKCPSIQAVLDMGGGTNTGIVRLLKQSYGIDEKEEIGTVPLVYSTDKTTRQHHLETPGRSRWTGFVCNCSTSAAVRCETENIINNTYSQPSGNLYRAKLVPILATQYLYIYHNQAPFLTLTMTPCPLGHCLSPTVDLPLGPTKGVYNLTPSDVASVLNLHQDTESLLTEISTFNKTSKTLAGQRKAAEVLREHLSHIPTGEELEERLPAMKVGSALQMMKTVRENIGFAKGTEEDFLKVAPVVGVVRRSFGSTSNSRIGFGGQLDKKILALETVASVAHFLRRTENLGSYPMTVEDWRKIIHNRPVIYPYIMVCFYTLRDAGAEAEFLKELTDLANIERLPGKTTTDVFLNFLKSGLPFALFNAENSMIFLRKWTMENPGKQPIFRDENGDEIYPEFRMSFVRGLVLKKSMEIVSKETTEQELWLALLIRILCEYHDTWLVLNEKTKMIDLDQCEENIRHIFKDPRSKGLPYDLPDAVKEMEEKFVSLYGVPISFNNRFERFRFEVLELLVNNPPFVEVMEKILTGTAHLLMELDDASTTLEETVSMTEHKFFTSSNYLKVVYTSSDTTAAWLREAGYVEREVEPILPRLSDGQAEEKLHKLVMLTSEEKNKIYAEYILNGEGRQVGRQLVMKDVVDPKDGKLYCKWINLSHKVAQKTLTPGSERLQATQRIPWIKTEEVNDDLAIRIGFFRGKDGKIIDPENKEPDKKPPQKKIIPPEEPARLKASGNADLKFSGMILDAMEDHTVLSQGGVSTLDTAGGQGAVTALWCRMAKDNMDHVVYYTDIDPDYEVGTGRDAPKLGLIGIENPAYYGRFCKGISTESNQNLFMAEEVKALAAGVLSDSTEKRCPVRIITCDAENPSFQENEEIHIVMMRNFISACVALQDGNPVCIMKCYLKDSLALAMVIALVLQLFRNVKLCKPACSYGHNLEFYVLWQGCVVPAKHRKILAEMLLDHMAHDSIPGFFTVEESAINQIGQILRDSINTLGYDRSNIKRFKRSLAEMQRSFYTIPTECPLALVQAYAEVELGMEKEKADTVAEAVAKVKRRKLDLMGQLGNARPFTAEDIEVQRKIYKNQHFHSKTNQLHQNIETSLLSDLVRMCGSVINATVYEFLWETFLEICSKPTQTEIVISGVKMTIENDDRGGALKDSEKEYTQMFKLLSTINKLDVADLYDMAFRDMYLGLTIANRTFMGPTGLQIKRKVRTNLTVGTGDHNPCNVQTIFEKAMRNGVRALSSMLFGHILKEGREKNMATGTAEGGIGLLKFSGTVARMTEAQHLALGSRDAVMLEGVRKMHERRKAVKGKKDSVKLVKEFVS